jgi:hypothetical protein
MNLHEEIDRQKNLMGISENPHQINAREFRTLDYKSSDAIVFEYRGDILYLAPQTTHGGGITLFYTNELRQNIPAPISTEIKGRIWTNSRLVSFWNYPKSQGELMMVIKNIYREADRIRKRFPNINLPEFSIKYIEIPWNVALNEPMQDWDTWALEGSSNFKIINIEDYEKYYKAKEPGRTIRNKYGL